MTKTDLLYLTDSYIRNFEATVLAVEGDRVALDQTAFYPGGGGQPADVGELRVEGVTHRVISADKVDGVVWHTIACSELHAGQSAVGNLDWERRYECMQTHTGMHVLCAVIGNEWGVPVTGGNMEPLSARMDFAFDPLPPNFRERVAEMVNAELIRGRRVVSRFIGRAEFESDPHLIRTKMSLVPDGLTSVRVVEIAGLDRQADGGTHVQSTAEIGPMTILKLESKGRSNKRLRVAFQKRLTPVTSSSEVAP